MGCATWAGKKAAEANAKTAARIVLRRAKRVIECLDWLHYNGFTAREYLVTPEERKASSAQT
jgi:hypothetical protein